MQRSGIGLALCLLGCGSLCSGCVPSREPPEISPPHHGEEVTRAQQPLPEEPAPSEPEPLLAPPPPLVRKHIPAPHLIEQTPGPDLCLAPRPDLARPLLGISVHQSLPLPRRVLLSSWLVRQLRQDFARHLETRDPQLDNSRKETFASEIFSAQLDELDVEQLLSSVSQPGASAFYQARAEALETFERLLLEESTRHLAWGELAAVGQIPIGNATRLAKTITYASLSRDWKQLRESSRLTLAGPRVTELDVSDRPAKAEDKTHSSPTKPDSPARTPGSPWPNAPQLVVLDKEMAASAWILWARPKRMSTIAFTTALYLVGLQAPQSAEVVLTADATFGGLRHSSADAQDLLATAQQILAGHDRLTTADEPPSESDLRLARGLALSRLRKEFLDPRCLPETIGSAGSAPQLHALGPAGLVLSGLPEESRQSLFALAAFGMPDSPRMSILVEGTKTKLIEPSEN